MPKNWFIIFIWSFSCIFFRSPSLLLLEFNVILSKINYQCSSWNVKIVWLKNELPLSRFSSLLLLLVSSSLMYFEYFAKSFTYDFFSQLFSILRESKRWMYVLNRQLYTTDWNSCATSQCWMAVAHYTQSHSESESERAPNEMTVESMHTAAAAAATTATMTTTIYHANGTHRKNVEMWKR